MGKNDRTIWVDCEFTPKERQAILQAACLCLVHMMPEMEEQFNLPSEFLADLQTKIQSKLYPENEEAKEKAPGA